MTLVASSTTYGIVLLLLSLLCLGTWPALLRLCSAPKLDPNSSLCGLRPQCRSPCRAYIDYTAAYVVASLIPILLALVSNPASCRSVVLTIVATFGGCLLSMGNLCMQWATSVYGAPLTTVLALEASLTVVLGTSLNYFLQPEMTAHPSCLFGGVLAFLIAIFFAAWAQTTYHAARQAYQLPLDEEDIEEQSETKPDNVNLGLGVAVAGGFCYAFFSPCFNVAVNDPFGWSSTGQLSVPAANLWFAVGFGALSMIANYWILIQQEGWQSAFFESQGSRTLAYLAGGLCAFGNLLQFQGGHLAGFAAADLVQAFPLVATLWDILMFGEFRRTNQAVCLSLAVMYLAYVGGIVLLAGSVSNGGD